jgi:hypothetical protein
MVSSSLAWLVAATSVILPYDVHFLGMDQAALLALNARLLAFMAHDRVTLAGAGLATGIIYVQLAWHAIRYAAHWASLVLASSALVGFAGFFLFLGHGYFDPLHATVWVILFPLLLLGMRVRNAAPPRVPVPDLRNDRAWRKAQWGQFGFVVMGVGLLGAGLTIATVGVTQVFVPQDLAFLCTTPAALSAANPRLITLIAHDRAGLGGTLLSCGTAVLLLSLWGVRRGAGWVWWTLLLAGAVGFGAALGVHVVIGYLDFWHLLPAYLGLAIFVPSLLLLHSYLCWSGES